MKANFTQLKEWNQLKPSEQKKIMRIADETENKDMMIILDIFLKMSCQVLHEAFGFGEKRLTMYLGNYRRTFRKHHKYVKIGEQESILDSQMIKIFKKNGYPDSFFKAMYEDWQVKTREEGNE